MAQQQQQEKNREDSTSNDEEKPHPSAEGLPSSSSSQKSLALRRQVGAVGTYGSETTGSQPVECSWPRHKKLLNSTRTDSSKRVMGEREDGSDTTTSEDSLGLKSNDSSNNNNAKSSSVSTDTTVFTSETIETADVSNPRIVIHRSGQHVEYRETPISSSGSTEDGSSSYCGFGVSRNERQDLILHLRGFCDLTDRQKWESPEGSRRGLSLSPSSVDEVFAAEGSTGCLSQYSDPFDDSYPQTPASLFVQKSFFHENDLEAFEGSAPGRENLTPRGGNLSETDDAVAGRERLESGSSFGKDLTLSPLQARVAHACLDGVHRAGVDGVSGSDAAGALDGEGGRCVAYGAGLSFGQVGAQNNFQVSLCVYMCGGGGRIGVCVLVYVCACMCERVRASVCVCVCVCACVCVCV